MNNDYPTAGSVKDSDPHVSYREGLVVVNMRSYPGGPSTGNYFPS